MKTPRCFVTGGTGFVGRHLIRHLISREIAVSALTRDQDQASALESMVARPGLFHTFNGDLCQAEGLQEWLRDGGTIIHLAAATPAHPSSGYRRVNVEGTRHLCAAAQRCRARFIHISSLNASRVTGAYGQSKLDSEDIVRQSGLDYCILRPALVYGPGDTGMLGRISAAIRNTRLAIIPNGGQNRFQPIHVDDLCEAILQVFADPRLGGRILEIAGEDIITLGELIGILRQGTGRCSLPFILSPSLTRAVLHCVGMFQPQTRCRLQESLTDRVAAENALPEFGLAKRDLAQELLRAYSS